MTNCALVILAAGLGKRLGGDIPKVIATTNEKPLILHLLETVSSLNFVKIICVVGYKKELVINTIESSFKLKNLQFVEQTEQLGTGHAIICALKALEDFIGDILILNGDTPLIKASSIESLLALHSKESADISLITLFESRENSYGKIIRTNGDLKEIKEDKDCDAHEKLISEVNPAVYVVKADFLRKAIKKINNNNANKEYYLTDVLKLAISNNLKVASFSSLDVAEFQGVNAFDDLALVNKELVRRRIKNLSKKGVSFIDPESTFIDKDVKIESGVSIGSNVSILGISELASNIKIEGTAYINNTKIAADTIIKLGFRSEDSIIGKNCSIGPFVNLRPGTKIANNIKLGNFVEIKNSEINSDSKVPHLTYIGDAIIGSDVNIGAGTITCNYDGFNKNKTIIKDRASIGANSSLVAPVTISEDAYVGAGSVITKNVPAGDLAICRAEQKNIAKGAIKRKRKYKQDV